MKKLLFITFIILSTINFSFSQNSFKKIISPYDYQQSFSVAEDDSGNFAILGRVSNIDSLGYWYSDIIKINNQGDFIKDTLIFFNGNRYKELCNMEFFNGFYYITGVIGTETYYVQPPYNTKIWITKFNKNLNLVKQDTLPIKNDRWLWSQKFLINNDTNLIFYGEESYWFDTIHNNSWTATYEPYIYKATINGDSLLYETNHSYEEELIENTAHNGYYVVYDNKLCFFDKNINLIKSKSLPIYFSYSNIDIAQVHNDTLIVCGISNGKFTVATIDTMPNIISSKKFNGLDLLNFNSLDSKNDNYFVCGMAGDTFKIYKLNADLTIEWEKVTDGDYTYTGNYIRATNDGGCIVVGNRFDSATQISGDDLDIYAIKIGPDGTIQWNNSFTIKPNINIYPNPGNNYINIKTNKNYSQFIMYDISGKKVLSQNGIFKTINTQNLKQGIYIYKILDKNGKTLKTGKWIKN